MNNSLAYAFDNGPTLSSGQSDKANNGIRLSKVTIASNDDPFNVRRNLGEIKLYPIYPVFAINVDGELRTLKSAIQLHIRHEDGYYFSENEALNIYGHGESIAEVTKSAVSDISYFYNHYISLEDNELVGKGLELKRTYSQIL